MVKGITFGRTNKFDLQLSDALINERRLGEIFAYRRIEKVELKTETWLWERTGNIVIEYKQNGEPSGIAVTEADYWVHELKRKDETLVYLLFPINRLRRLCREWYDQGSYRENCGDGGRFCNILIPLNEILK